MYGLINNIITINIDDSNWEERAKKSALLIIHTMFRLLQSPEPMKWDDPLSLCKLAGEGKLYKQKTCVGWDIQTCCLRLFLPKEKETSWVQDIRASLASIKIKTNKLESLFGKLNCASHIIPTERYLLTRLLQLLKRGNGWIPKRL